MASIRDVVDGLEILAKYAEPMRSGATGRDVNIGGADHDVIYGPNVGEISAEDKGRIDDLGWHWDEEYDCWCRFC